MDTIGKRLRQLREDRGMKQAEVAEATGVDRGHLSVVERDKGRLSLESVRALAQFYGVSLEWLVEGRGPMRMDPRAEAILSALDALPAAERETHLRVIFARRSDGAAAA